MENKFLSPNIILKLSPNILKRYEHNIGDGVIYLFDVLVKELWMGNNSANDLIQVIDGQNTLGNIYEALSSSYEDYSYDELKASFDSVIQELIDKNFLEFANS